jgi:hypothetical protein
MGYSKAEVRGRFTINATPENQEHPKNHLSLQLKEPEKCEQTKPQLTRKEIRKIRAEMHELENAKGQ